MITLIRNELQKLKGSLALLVAVAAPALPGLLVMLGLVSKDSPANWSDSYKLALPLWALFLGPMVIAAFTALTGQIEHRGRGWDHILALPVPRWRIFVAKIVVTYGALVVMTALVIAGAGLGTLAGGAMGGGVPVETFPWEKLLKTSLLVMAAMTTLVAIQIWVSLRFVSFVVPLVTGIGGALVGLSVLITGTQKAEWFPWVLPFNAIVSPDPYPFAMTGLFCGLAIIGIMVPHLSRHQFR
ncbi:ABC transporter permease [Porphyrobacter sp. CACIAM 03H1]|uniref:ABC transporter permease n=1 Tax=Porphyrobacter sp. CACIAM 03H1 TaxID=2003315 RepID=UPI000B5A7F9C|nr:ABC transporter permease [Porphyrobacter sp. CACIAM 03H1]ASJ91935.1 hypothetical protein CBR61_14055 [Porphyrobacter sp. CACIAM 03H1]